MGKGYTPTKSTVSLSRPAGRTSATGTNSPTKTQANRTSQGKTAVTKDPTDNHGVRGGHAVGTK